ncbi:extracellular solute-binding protein family 1 [Kribbella flavida DSM 17836]|uniref:Extracellular solute-binding protein family 1 n=1 Tax=Kribbella flavida (strain DSM 17836 / JCM 10339 / NBRC 14399) TaxID=479435 RepID=D2PPF3_KRIFD|nr:extracellular solute-binding protein [Kribbella flavida]ADB30915.1 extracellular solute-binding protein family 1 [Kribbella flavida DSM 17836]
MRSPRTMISIGAALVSLALVLAGCGGQDDDAAQSGTGTFKLWHYESANGAMGKAWDKAIEVFKAEHPGVTVEFERKAFEQIQQNASMILASDQAPDLMEYNKGNATAGLLSSKGLLTDLSDEVTGRGWDKLLSPSLQTTARYDEKGVMGSGSWFGVPNYGEYVMVYYNKDLFQQHGVAVPKTLDELTKAMDTFVAKKITPLGMAGAEYPAGQLYYQLALSKADRSFVDNYQLYKGPVSFDADPLKYGAETFRQWVDKGYVSQRSASLKAEDMGTAFIAGKTPMIVSGSWWYGRFSSEIKKFQWGTFLFPGNKLNAGSSGNLWVVPEQSKNKKLAYDFIDITMRPEIQTILGNNGGVPVNADLAKVTDLKNKELIANFAAITAADGLAFYPDWPVPGYYDVLVAGGQSLINGSKNPQQVLTELGKAYEQGVSEIENG